MFGLGVDIIHPKPTLRRRVSSRAGIEDRVTIPTIVARPGVALLAIPRFERPVVVVVVEVESRSSAT